MPSLALISSRFLPHFRCFRRNASTSKSFVWSLYSGELEASQFTPFPKALNSEQLETLQQMVEPTVKFFQEQNNPVKNEELEAIEEKTVEGLKALGAYGLQVPEKYGGVGLNNTQYARMVEVVGANDLGVGIALGAHQSIGFKGIMLHGTDAQKEKYLPSLASGETIAAYCLTEPSMGSDASAVQTRAVKSSDGSYYTLNGSKLWISNGGTGDLFTVFAQTSVYDKKSKTEKDKLSAFIVERNFGGIESSPPEKKMGIKCSNTAALFLEDVKVPAENLLGSEGEGFKIAMHILNNGRFGMAAALSGTMRNCISVATNHAINRTQFGDKICNYGAIQEKIAKMTARHYMTESLAYALSGMMDIGVLDFEGEAAVSKVFASEAAWFCCDEAIQTLGGWGYMKEAGLEKVMRDLRIFRIFEGTNDILRLMIAGLGFRKAGGILSKEAKSASGIAKIISRKALGTVGISAGADASEFKKHLHSELHNLADQLASAVGLFGASAADFLMKYKAGIKDRQFELKLFAECAMELFASAVTLSRASQSLQLNLPSSESEIKIAELACLLSFNQIKQTLNGMKSSESQSIYNLMQHVTQDVCKHEGVIQGNPLGV